MVAIYQDTCIMVSSNNEKESKMKILELATKLKAIYDEKGDIDVMVFDNCNNDP